jgi:predicted dehydrogenase
VRTGVAGLGSMGRRRTRDLLSLGHEVLGFDIRSDRSATAARDFGIHTAESAEELLDSGLEALVISTPPDRHADYYERALGIGLPFFSEANILTPSSAWFAERAANAAVLGYPSATMRFDPIVRALRERLAALDADGLRSIHYAGGDYLPRWHPYEPYDEFYAGAGRATSGIRESVPFELDWICWLLGPVATVQAIHRAQAEWRSDIDDTYLLLLDFESGVVGSVTMELHQQAPFKVVRLAHRDESFTLDFLGASVVGHRLGPDDSPVSGPIELDLVDREHVYLAEIRAFVEAVTLDRPYPKTWQEDRHVSDVLCAAEISENTGSRVQIADVHDGYVGTDFTKGPSL